MFVVATNGQAFVDNTGGGPATRVVPARPGSLLLRNVGSSDCYLGNDSTVLAGVNNNNTTPTATGFLLKAGEIFQPNSTGEIWGKCVTGSSTAIAWWSEADRFSPGTAD